MRDPFDELPPTQRIVKEINAFLTIKDNGVERAQEQTGRPR